MGISTVNNKSLDELNLISSKIIGGCIAVHKELGPGLLESVYEICLAKELIANGFIVQRQVFLPVIYKEEKLDLDFRIDLLVNDEIVVELKAIEAILPVHEAQLLTYLKLSDKRLGLLINFNQAVLRDGIKRMINGY
jgi:GxxExxY protein